MPLALAVGFGIVCLAMLTTGQALNSQNDAQANQDFWKWLASSALLPFVWATKESVHYAKVLAKWMYPGLKFAEVRVASYFGGISKYGLYHANQTHRTTVALLNTAKYVTGPWAVKEAQKAKAATEATISHLFQTKAPTGPQRKISQHDADIAFQKLIDANFTKHLKQDFPKFDWDPGRWRKFLGVLPALGGAVVTQPHQPPQPQPVPKTKPSPNPADNPTTQPTTLPHTDDNPNPDPGTQVVPGVISGKDKYARGQIAQLKKRETSRWKHLGPLALLALGPVAIHTLIGLVECKNIQRNLKRFCGAPSHIFDDLLALFADFFILTNICTILPWLEAGFNVIEPAIAEVTAGAAAVACSNGYDRPAELRVPTLHLPPKPARLPVLQLP